MNDKPVQHVAFIDDSGNPDLDFSTRSVQQVFITTAVIIPLDKLQQARAQVDATRQAFFQIGEMAAEGVVPNRRLKILQRLQGVDFKFYSLVVDKAKIWADSGLKFKRSFLKSITGKLTYELHKMFPSLAVVCDEHGSREFMDGFKKYLLHRHPEDIMFRAEFASMPKVNFRDSKDEVLLQSADFIAGTLLRCFDPRMKENDAGLYLKCLEDKRAAPIEFWPKLFRGDDQPCQDDSFDELIAAYCQKRGQEYLWQQAKKPPQKYTRLRTATVERLLYEMGHHYVYADEIVVGLRQEGIFLDEDMTRAKNLLQRRSISRLRDSGVIIASGDDGYKLPTSRRDLLDYFKSIETKVAPQVARVGRARDQIMAMSSGNLDMLQDPSLVEMRALFEGLSKTQQPQVTHMEFPSEAV